MLLINSRQYGHSPSTSSINNAFSLRQQFHFFGPFSVNLINGFFENSIYFFKLRSKKATDRKYGKLEKLLATKVES